VGKRKANFKKLLSKISDFYASVMAYANRYFDDVYCGGTKIESGFIYDVKSIIDKHLEEINPQIIVFPIDEGSKDEQTNKCIGIYKLYEKMSIEMTLLGDGLKMILE
jgi:hypothetical protein